jgi:hypothetical protein
LFGLGELFQVYGTVEELEFSDGFAAHLKDRATYAKHSVTLVEILQAHQGDPHYFLNQGPAARSDPDHEHRAPIVMVGPTEQARMLSVPLEPTGRWGIWRPVTAFESNTHHRDRYYEESRDDR